MKNNNPWEHMLIHNCIDTTVFVELENTLSLIFKNISSGNYTFDIYDLFLKGMSIRLIEYLIEYSEKNILDNCNSMLSNFSYHREFNTGYICIPQIGISKNKRHGIHDDTDGNYKIMTYLIYISPEVSSGTELYRSNTYESDFFKIPWNRNSGIYFCPKKHVTYHDFSSDNELRITLNLNLSSIDFLLDDVIRNNFFKNIDKNKLEWLLFYFRNGKFHRTGIDIVNMIQEELDKK